MYLESYDKNRRRTGVLVDATDIQRKRRLNSDYELSFLVPMTSADFRDKLQLKGHVKDERGQYYVINSRQRVRDGRKLTASVSCSHVMFKLTDYKIPYASYISEAYGVHITTLLNVISAATGGKFTFSVDDTFTLHDVKDWGRGNALQALNDVIKMYECEVEPDNFTIHIRKKIGTDNGLQYRLGKNVVSTNFKDDAGSLVTRMFAQMKDGRTWIGQPASILTDEERGLLSQVPGAVVDGKLAVNYLISPYQSTWANDTNPFFDGEIIEQDIENPVQLLDAARTALRKNEIPALEVSVSAADLFKLDKTEPRPSLGDIVTLIDPELGVVDVSARITEITEYPYTTEKHAQVTVSNAMIRDFTDIIADLEKSKNIVDNLFSGGKIRTEAFEAFANQAIKDINASKTEIKYDERGIILISKLDNRNQVALTSNGIVVSTDGMKTARAAITDGKIVAELIVGQIGNFASLLIGSGNNVTQINTKGIAAGHTDFNSAPARIDMQGNAVFNKLTANSAQINTSNVNGSTWKDGYFTGNVTAQGEITGGTITGALIRTAASGQRIELDASGLYAKDSSNRIRVSIAQSGKYGVAGVELSDESGSFRGGVYGVYEGLYLEAPKMMNLYSPRIAMNGFVDFGNASVSGISKSSITGLDTELTSIRLQIDGKASKGSQTDSAGPYNCGIPIGTQFKSTDGAVYTWAGVPSHSHNQR
ncbi:phage tail spike protein [Paenibacillus terrigena]|uniref:phage tail spike protein n=1 Tax=Paenibacillus terrigena TaxID=369333 RepID=UPI000382CABF|nr:phage tail spike protein [Paenibacillus terrigena]